MGKIFTNKKYLRTIRCLEDGVVYKDIKHMCSVIYGMEFRNYNSIGRLIDKGLRVRGDHYIFC